MITGFEDITYELTDYEKNILLPVMIKGLQQMVGKNNAFTNKQCCEKLKRLGHEVDDPRFRKIIHHIRVNNLVPRLIASSKGYYVTNDRNELQAYLSSLKERRNSINEIIKSLEQDIQTLI